MSAASEVADDLLVADKRTVFEEYRPMFVVRAVRESISRNHRERVYGARHERCLGRKLTHVFRRYV